LKQTQQLDGQPEMCFEMRIFNIRQWNILFINRKVVLNLKIMVNVICIIFSDWLIPLKLLVFMSYGPKRFNKVESTTHLEILEVKCFSDLPRCRNKVVGVVLEVGVARGNDLKMKKKLLV
jgi:hypothetical protein